MISRTSWFEMGFGARNVARFGFVATLPPRIMEVENGRVSKNGATKRFLSPLFLGCVFPHDVVAFYYLSCITLNTSKMTKIQLLQDPFCCNYTISIYIHHKSSFKTTLGEAYFSLGGIHLTSSFAEVYRRAVVQSCRGDSVSLLP